MKKIKLYLVSNYGLKTYIVFNSHSHWDHIWGNCEFEDSTIISHEKCKKLIQEEGHEDLERYKATFAKEKIVLVEPNKTFVDRLVFEEDEVEFFYSPGHSEDASSCYDHKDKTLFVGDNMDEPIPSFFSWFDLKTYKSTLEDYLTFKAVRLVQSHGDVMKPEVIEDNINYLSDLLEDRPLSFKDDEVNEKHQGNLRFIESLNK